MLKGFLLIMLLGFCSSCAVVNGGVEVAKTIWGSSTRALEEARTTALVKTYDQSYWETIRAAEEYCNKHFLIFKKEEVKGYFIIMHVRGAVNTTEVGIFFVEVKDKQTRVEISSLSTHAKRIVAKHLFHGLDVAFGLVPPDAVIYGEVPKIDFINADANAASILDTLIKQGVLAMDPSENIRLRVQDDTLKRPEEMAGTNFDKVWYTLGHMND